MNRGDFLEIEFTFERMKQFIVDQAAAMHAQKFGATRRDRSKHDIVMRVTRLVREVFEILETLRKRSSIGILLEQTRMNDGARFIVHQRLNGGELRCFETCPCLRLAQMTQGTFASTAQR